MSNRHWEDDLLPQRFDTDLADDEATRRTMIEERTASLAYAAANGYDVDPVTGQYLEPK